MIPIQMNNSTNGLNGANFPSLINAKPGASCNGYNGKLNMYQYGLKPGYKLYLDNLYKNVGKLAQYETVNSPYYTQVKIDPNYIKFIEGIIECNKNH
jgi:hypothetical protein